ncbi:MAG: energy transducer TonB [Fulvivirga sp.]
MKIFITLILSLFCIATSAQELSYIKSKTEIYSVLKDNPEVKHGDYKKIKKKSILESGQFDNGNKVGPWSFYDEEGKVELIYDFSTNKVIENHNLDQFSNYKTVNDETKPEILPVYIGGRSGYNRFISENLEYPKDSKSKGIEGRQFVIITLSEQGEIIESKVYRPIAPDIYAEALRLISELPNKWTPAINQGKPVKVTIGLPVQFIL